MLSAIYNFREKKIGPETYTLSGHSVFYKNAKGEIFHTYGAFARGDEQFMGIFGFFDVLPKRREEYGPAHSIPDWQRFTISMKAMVRPRVAGGRTCEKEPASALDIRS